MIAPPVSSPAQGQGPVVRALLAAAIAFAACLVARLLAFGDAVGFVVWPAAAVAFAYGWRHGLGWVLPAGIGAAAFTGATYGNLSLAIGAGLASTLGPAAAIATLARLGTWKPADYRLEAALRFVSSVLIIAAPIDALVAGAALQWIPLGDTSGPFERIAAWWLLDALGLLLVAPALLAWTEPAQPDAEPEPATAGTLDAASLLLSALIAAAGVAFASFDHPRWGQALLYLYFPIVAWTTVRLSERATATTLLATALPLLAARAWSTRGVSVGDAFAVLESSIIVLCALLVGLILQAVAADRRYALARVARQARQDMSTGLLNDRGLLAELGERLASPERTHYGLVGVHLSNFDTLHDLCGPMQALQLEQNASGLLMRQPGSIAGARLSSGRYALLVSADTVAQVRSVARELYSQLNGQVFKIDHGSLRLQVSVGGLLIDRHVVINSEDCMMSLSDALAIAASVRDPQLFVEPLSQTMIDARRSHQGKMEHIREAIREQRFAVYAQPIVDPDATDGSLSYEVLTRLRDRDGGLIRPPEFLPLAIQAQMTVALDRGVIKAVFAFLAANPAALARTHKCSINLSGLTMSDGTIAGYIREQRTTYGIPAEKVVFEITESEAIRNPGAASRLVDDLKADGFGIALDDFGTGLATFEYLKRFPLDYLKIDGSFIRNLVSNPIDEEIVLSTIRVARRLNVKTVAEHVHSQDIYDRLKLLGIEYIQGELISTPKPIAELFEPGAQITVPARQPVEHTAGTVGDAR